VRLTITSVPPPLPPVALLLLRLLQLSSGCLAVDPTPPAPFLPRNKSCAR
jgi:hypothetical protein